MILELTEKQANVIREGMELLARLGMGQIDHLNNVWFLNERGFKNDQVDHKGKEDAFQNVKNIYFPELYGHQYHGMTSEKVDETAKMAWDIYQVIRHVVSWHNHPNGGITVNFDEPFKVSEESLPICQYKNK